MVIRELRWVTPPTKREVDTVMGSNWLSMTRAAKNAFVVLMHKSVFFLQG